MNKASGASAGLGLWGRLVLGIVVLFLALGAAYAFVLLPAIHAALLAQEQERLELHARLVAGHVALGVEAAFREVEALAATDALRGTDAAALDEALLRAKADTQAFLFFYLVDPRGRIEARPDRLERVGEDRSAGDYFREIAAGRRRFVSDVWITPLMNRTVTLSVPVRAPDGALRGVLVGVLGCMDRNPQLYRFVTEPVPGEQCQVGVATRTGELLASSAGPDIAPAFRPFLEGSAGGVASTELDEHWLAAGARVENTAWTVVARVPKQLAQARLTAATRRFAALVLPFLVGVFVVAVVAVRGLARRLVALTSALARYGAEGRADPIEVTGRDEVAAAARAFNRMLEDRDRAAAERTALEERLRLAARMETVGKFASGVAHDLNNLLTPILTYTELLQADAPADSKQREWATEALGVTLHARDLAQQVLTYGRVAAPRREPLQLAPLVEEALRVLRRVIPEPVTLRLDLAQKLEVEGDPTQLHQVVLNLTVNAVHAIGARPGTIDVRLARDGERAVLSVSDTGCGMDEATRARVFEPFYSTKELGRGTGLGLAIVHGIVTAHGGEVTARSAPGQGSTFEVRLPPR